LLSVLCVLCGEAKRETTEAKENANPESKGRQNRQREGSRTEKTTEDTENTEIEGNREDSGSREGNGTNQRKNEVADKVLKRCFALS